MGSSKKKSRKSSKKKQSLPNDRGRNQSRQSDKIPPPPEPSQSGQLEDTETFDQGILIDATTQLGQLLAATLALAPTTSASGGQPPEEPTNPASNETSESGVFVKLPANLVEHLFNAENPQESLPVILGPLPRTSTLAAKANGCTEVMVEPLINAGNPPPSLPSNLVPLASRISTLDAKANASAEVEPIINAGNPPPSLPSSLGPLASRISPLDAKANASAEVEPIINTGNPPQSLPSNLGPLASRISTLDAKASASAKGHEIVADQAIHLERLTQETAERPLSPNAISSSSSRKKKDSEEKKAGKRSRNLNDKATQFSSRMVISERPICTTVENERRDGRLKIIIKESYTLDLTKTIEVELNHSDNHEEGNDQKDSDDDKEVGPVLGLKDCNEDKEADRDGDKKGAREDKKGKQKIKN